MAAVSAVMEWSTEMEVFLIEEVQKKNNIWDVRDSLYSKKVLKRISYEEISIKLIEKWPEKASLFTVDLLLRKFNNLKTYYRRERKKLLHLKSGSAGMDFHPRWEHFSRLSFLADSCIAEESRSNIVLPNTPVTINPETPQEQSLAIDEDGENIDSSIVDENQTKITSLSLLTSVTDESLPNVTPTGRKRKRQASAALTELTTCLKSLNEAQEDAEEAFGRYIALELKSIKDESKRDLAKLKIQSMLYNFKYGSE